jgi:hypothetical protein
MIKFLKTIVVGCVFFLVVSGLAIVIAYIKCFFMGLHFDWLIALKIAIKGGLLAAIVTMTLFAIGGPRPMTPGGR